MTRRRAPPIRLRTLLLAAFALAAVAIVVERLWVTPGERFASTDGLVDAVAPAQLDRLPSSGRSPRRVLGGAQSAVGRAGLGPLAWAASTEESAYEVESARGRFHVLTQGGLAALDAATGRPLWQRLRPAGPATIEPLRDGVAMLTAPGGRSKGRSAVRATAFDDAGEPVRAVDLGDSEAGPTDLRAGIATDPARELLATVSGDDERSEVRLFRDGGREEAWKREVKGDWAEVAVAGDIVVLGNATSDPPERTLLALDLDDGDERWSVPLAVARAAAPEDADPISPGEGARLVTPRIAGTRVLAQAAIQTSAAGDQSSGRLLAFDARSGRLAWRGPAVPGRGSRALLEPVGGVVLSGGPEYPFTAVDLASGKVRWARDLEPGKDLGSVAPTPGRTYLTGGRPVAIDLRTGRAEALAAAGKRFYWFTLGGAVTAGHLVVATQEGYLFAYRLATKVA